VRTQWLAHQAGTEVPDVCGAPAGSGRAMRELPETVGRYHIERLIAQGGMGSVYLARDPAIDRLVVIKFLKEGFDAAAARRLHHPNIVTIFDVGEHEDRPFIAMEYVPGETLAQLVGRRAVRTVWEKVGILDEL
jgi:serine/threonine protein kinase